MTILPPPVNLLAHVVTRRPHSMFQVDYEYHQQSLRDRIAGMKLLVVGGAGSIGAATVKELLLFKPRELVVIDVDENNLAELVRDVRSGDLVAPETRLRIIAADFGGPFARRVLQEASPFDRVLNFAAVKHVRSERDVPSVLHMLDVNLVRASAFLDCLDEFSPEAAYFAVSTDKAANPVNLMGASKRAMEQMMFTRGGGRFITSARFANVAFSNGSLLEGWLKRLDKRQPWAVPAATRRFFVSSKEAGQLCVMASAIAPDRSLLVPVLNPQSELRDLQDVATDVLARIGFTAQIYAEESQARSSLEADMKSQRYPLLVTKLDTTGEKSFEEFIADADKRLLWDADALQAIRPWIADPKTVAATVTALQGLFMPDAMAKKSDIVDVLKSLVPELDHNDSKRSLDDRM